MDNTWEALGEFCQLNRTNGKNPTSETALEMGHCAFRNHDLMKFTTYSHNSLGT